MTSDAIALKIRRAKTDPLPLPEDAAGLAERPEARNLVGIYAALMDTDHAGVLREHGGKNFGPFKEALAELLVEKLAPIAAETRRWLADPASVDRVLAEGAEKAASHCRSDRGGGGAAGGVPEASAKLHGAPAVEPACPRPSSPKADAKSAGTALCERSARPVSPGGG